MIYESTSSKILEKEEEFTHNMINDYFKLYDSGDNTNLIDQLNSLEKTTNDFMSYLKIQEMSQQNADLLESQRRHDKHLIHKIYNGNNLTNKYSIP